MSSSLLALFLPPARAEPLLIAAAADLAPLQNELAAAISKSTGIAVRFTFAGSGMLARQIEHGAPYDLYLSANEEFVRDLAKSSHVLRETVTVYATGRLGLWSKSGKILRPADIRGTLALPNPVHAPYGAAAREMLRRMGLWQTLEPRVVYGENVLQAWQFAQTGNAEACITAWSLVRDKGGIQLPAAEHPAIRQVGAVVAGKRREQAARVLGWLAGPDGRRLLEAHGFGAP